MAFKRAPGAKTEDICEAYCIAEPIKAADQKPYRRFEIRLKDIKRLRPSQQIPKLKKLREDIKQHFIKLMDVPDSAPPGWQPVSGARQAPKLITKIDNLIQHCNWQLSAGNGIHSAKEKTGMLRDVCEAITNDTDLPLEDNRYEAFRKALDRVVKKEIIPDIRHDGRQWFYTQQAITKLKKQPELKKYVKE